MSYTKSNTKIQDDGISMAAKSTDMDLEKASKVMSQGFNLNQIAGSNGYIVA